MTTLIEQSVTPSILSLSSVCVCGKEGCSIPYGLCHCGCGEPVDIAKINRSERNQVKGLPLKFKMYHAYNHKPPQPRRDTKICICLNKDCEVPRGLCHCGCGKVAHIANKTDNLSGRIEGMPMEFLPGHNFRVRPIIEEAKPFKINGVYCRLIPLTRGLYTIVWESDYKWLMQWKWTVCWFKKTNSYYAVRSEIINKKNKIILMHRQILGLDVGDKTTGDHIRPEDSLDNRRDNLRKASHKEQQWNKPKYITNTSGYKGVTWNFQRGKWQAQIMANKVYHHLGLFVEKEGAARAFDMAALLYHGEFAYFNFPDKMRME